MADRTIKPDDTNDLVLSNNDGSSKLELNEDQTVKVTTGSDADEDFTVNTTQLVVEGDTGNVGIGDTTPSSTVGYSGPILSLKGAQPTIIWKDTQSGTYDWEMTAVSDEFRLHRDNTYVLRIDGNNNIGIGADAYASTRLWVDSVGNTSSTNACVLRNSDDANLMYVSDNGYTWAYQAWATSDRRKKKNISYVTEDILPKIENLKLAKFDMKDTALENCYGFIAQEVEELFPDCIDDTKMPGSDILYESGDEIPEGKEIGDVKEEGEEQKNLNYNYLFSHLVKAIQELSAKVTALENA